VVVSDHVAKGKALREAAAMLLLIFLLMLVLVRIF